MLRVFAAENWSFDEERDPALEEVWLQRVDSLQRNRDAKLRR